MFRNNNESLSPNQAQSGFRSGHSCVTTTLKVLNDIICAIDNKEYCVAAFVDLAKAFDSVDHEILLDRLRHIGLSESGLVWFRNYCSGLISKGGGASVRSVR